MKVLGLFNWSPLKPLERCLLGETQRLLSPRTADVLRGQVDAVRRVLRMPHGWTELDFYLTRRAVNDPGLRFPVGREGLHFATLRFRCPPEQGTWVARLYAVNGHFFQILISPSPRRIMCSAAIEVRTARLHHDPLVPLPPAPVPGAPLDAQALTGWPREFVNAYPVSDVRGPLPAEERRNRERACICALPEDYLEMTNQCEGFLMGACAVYGLLEVHEVATHDATWCVLAEYPDGALGVQADTADRNVYLLLYSGAEPTNLGASFAGALRSVLGRA